jgi:hypothetical protein
MKTIRHFDYSLGVPNGWIDASVVSFVGPHQDDYSPSMTVTRDYVDSPISPAEYAAVQRRELEAELGDLGFLVLEEGPCSIQDAPAFRRVYTFDLEDIGKVQQLQVYLVRASDALTITATDLAARFNKSLLQFLQMLDGFRFEDI